MAVIRQGPGLASIRHIVLIFLVTCFPSCSPSPKIPLSPEEEKLCAAFAGEYKCEVYLEHDYFSVSGNGSNGTFYAILKSADDHFCSKDSAYIKATASTIAKNITRVLSHRENYRSVSVAFWVEKSTGKDMYQTLCSREVDVSVDSPGVGIIRDWWTPEERKLEPSDHIIEW